METWDFHYIRREDEEYENARRAAVWNGRVPERYPDLIVYPKQAEHVQTIVRYAKTTKMRIGVKSGGHSWTASFLQDGGILIDLINMKKFSFDVRTSTAEAQPAAYASTLNQALLEHNLMFPGGHCPTVGLGGFLLQGGFGWNSRKWGMACESVLAIDVINADGDFLHADPYQNSEYFWAARGSGCGYFAIVIRFYLKLHPLPRGIMTARYVFEISDLETVLTEVDSVSDQVSPDLEIGMFVARDQDGFNGRPTLAITADALSETKEEAKAALDLLHNLPSFSKTIKSYPYISCTLKEMMRRLDEILDHRGLRYEVNNLWTDVPVKTLVPSFRKIIKDLPPAPAHLYMTYWLPIRSRPEMAFSMEARLYVALYVISGDQRRDVLHSNFVVDSMKLMDEHKKGIQLADENLPAHPGKFMATHKYVKVEQLRRTYDPEGRFYGYMRVPEEFNRSWACI